MKNICDWNNCNEIGEYKAPVEKDNSKKYRMLCLEHVKKLVTTEHQWKGIIARNIECFAWSMLKNLIKIGIIFQE